MDKNKKHLRDAIKSLKKIDIKVIKYKNTFRYIINLIEEQRQDIIIVKKYNK